MKQSIFIYLKRNGLSTIQIVNKLFVSAFLRHYGIVPRNNILLQEFYIKDNRQEESHQQDGYVAFRVFHQGTERTPLTHIIGYDDQYASQTSHWNVFGKRSEEKQDQ